MVVLTDIGSHLVLPPQIIVIRLVLDDRRAVNHI